LPGLGSKCLSIVATATLASACTSGSASSQDAAFGAKQTWKDVAPGLIPTRLTDAIEKGLVIFGEQ
jgi:hypothetical protein